METVELLKDGIYPDMGEEEYRALPFANASILKILATKSPKHANHARTNPTPQTPAMLFGSAYHCEILRPDDFTEEFIISDDCAATKKDGTPCENPGKNYDGKQWFCGTHGKGIVTPPGKQVIQLAEFEQIVSMREALNCHRKAQTYINLKDASAECVIIWTDPATGVRCKAKIDLWGSVPDGLLITDLKSCDDASDEGFSTQIAKYDYDIQAAFYSDGLSVVTGGGVVGFVFIAHEKDPPYACAPYWLPQEDIAFGRARYRDALKKWQVCQTMDIWPGYAGGEIRLPEWHRKKKSQRI